MRNYSAFGSPHAAVVDQDGVVVGGGCPTDYRASYRHGVVRSANFLGSEARDPQIGDVPNGSWASEEKLWTVAAYVKRMNSLPPAVQVAVERHAAAQP